MPEGYLLESYIADLRAITAETEDESEILKRVRPLAGKLSRDTTWVTDEVYRCNENQGFGVHLLHEEADHSLAVFAVAWLPDHSAPAHDHGTWAVVAGVDGDERNTFYSRLDDGARPGYAELREQGHRTFGPGEVLCMRTGAIHAVWNDSGRVTVSLHTYGRHINHTERAQFDPESNKAQEFKVQVE